MRSFPGKPLLQDAHNRIHSCWLSLSYTYTQFVTHSHRSATTKPSPSRVLLGNRAPPEVAGIIRGLLPVQGKNIQGHQSSQGQHLSIHCCHHHRRYHDFIARSFLAYTHLSKQSSELRLRSGLDRSNSRFTLLAFYARNLPPAAATIQWPDIIIRLRLRRRPCLPRTPEATAITTA